ncbi:hypothetical protein MGYG_06034 [Nannizzia gypsea CBS 118893]|uniref:Vacuolar protein sorting-associated protein VTA1 n=1 Tax=Arthroderma gypseum (strain ATCC MYA-4604 / CBS 118893) TaxID=535722 RepID=E4V097_ARTGP|nr:hypothetical protein MGYG_06034 [Nannizzia gypsea CBS 118893]EFR03034.1 hypothetical protein MGYG_06034 [Nannizzia gypsea CBS 118893]
MSTNIPAGLKAADISRFVTRAAQLEKAKPTISYWCNFWAVTQILDKKLHNSDEECLKYTTELMDKLEKFKQEHSEDDTITDDAAGQAYVEQFALETFQRAENAVRANKASMQTADTFQAAATFLDLGQAWGQPDAETASKVKYAKYHAVRIIKAIKAGEDPNSSNPKHAEASQEPLSPAEGTDIAGDTQALSEAPRKGRQASVEDVPDDFDKIQSKLAAQSSLNESLHPSRSSSAAPLPQPTGGLNIPSVPTSTPGSGMPSPPISIPPGMVDFDDSLRQRPSQLSRATVPDLPAAPSDFPSPASSNADLPSQLGPRFDSSSLNVFQSFPPPAPEPEFPPTESHALGPPPRTSPGMGVDRTSHPQPPMVAPITQIPRDTLPVSSSTARAGNSAQTVDEEAISNAQKHARWAVSALNFDDVNTAIKELQNALNFLRYR